MTKNFKGLISIWLTVIMLLGLMVSPIQVGAAGNEGEVLVYKHNITPFANNLIDVYHSADYYTPSDGQRLIDAPDLMHDISPYFGDGIAGFEVWTYGDTGDGCGYVFYEKKAFWSKDYTLSQTDIDTYDCYDSTENYVFIPVEVPEVYVGGVKLKLDVPYVNSDGTVTSDGATDQNYNAKLSVTIDGAVLDINNLDVEGQVGDFELWDVVSGWTISPQSAGIASKSDLTINVTGDNSVKGVKNTQTQTYDECSAGILLFHNSVTFTGAGKIGASAEDVRHNSAGIFARNISCNGAEITASAGDLGSYGWETCGVYAYYGDITINSGKLVANAGTGPQGTGISAYSLTVTAGILESEVSSDAEDKYAIYSSIIAYSDGSQPDSNWYKWRTQKDGDWNISSDGNQYDPANDGSENYVFIAERSYNDPGSTPTPNPTPTPTPNPRPSSGGGTLRYSVKFDTDGGSEIKKQNVVRNSKVTKPEDPVKDGYTFAGWYDSDEYTSEYDFEKPVIKSFTIFAKWIEETEISSGGEGVSSSGETSGDGPSSDHTLDCPSAKFNDVERDVWYHIPVDYVLENKIMQGYDNSLFGINDNLTRGMIVTILYRMEGEPATNRSIPFADVDMGDYYANAVSWAKQNGIVNGVSDTEFRPDDNVTRQDFAVIMHRYAKYKGYDVTAYENTNILTYTDFADIAEYAIPAIEYVVGTKILTGNSQTTLNPLGNATRAQAAAIIQRFIEYNK